MDEQSTTEEHSIVTDPANHSIMTDPAESEERFDLLVADLGRRGLRARRTGADPEARIDPPRPSRSSSQVAVEIGALIEALAPLLEAVPSPPDHIVVAIRGAAGLLDPAELRSRLSVVSNSQVVVCDAIVTTLFGALGEVASGTVLDLGAGVVGLATDLEGVWHRIDGWGPILGDRGSAAWVGAAGLAAGLRARDGVPGGSEELLAAGRHAFGDETHWAALLDDNPAADVLADFAPVVAELAARGDQLAQAIIRLGGEHLADALVSGKRVVPGGPIVATGELLLIEAIKVALASALGQRHKILVPALGDSLAGCRLLGRHLAGGSRLPHRPPFVYTHDQGAIAAG